MGTKQFRIILNQMGWYKLYIARCPQMAQLRHSYLMIGKSIKNLIPYRLFGHMWPQSGDSRTQSPGKVWPLFSKV